VQPFRGVDRGELVLQYLRGRSTGDPRFLSGHRETIRQRVFHAAEACPANSGLFIIISQGRDWIPPMQCFAGTQQAHLHRLSRYHACSIWLHHRYTEICTMRHSLDEDQEEDCWFLKVRG